MRREVQKVIRWLGSALLVSALAGLALAQQPITYQYFYDELGQLIKVVDSTGIVIEYVYDSVGNILEIKRSTVTAGSLAIFDFNPRQGLVGASVTIRGQGFSPTPSANAVKFNATVAPVQSATSATLAVTVPVGATTGPISVTVGAVTATTTSNFIVIQLPVITSVNPKTALVNTTIPNFQVTGANLTGAAFAFSPAFVPAAITVDSAVIDPSGNAATLGVTIHATANGTFVLIATNAAGSSDSRPSASNSLTVGPGEAVGLTFSVLNTAAPAPTVPTPREADGLAFSLLNQVPPAPTPPALTEADGLTFSLLNRVSPAPTQPTLMEADSLILSVLNQVSPALTQPALIEADSLTFSLLNQVSPAPTQPTLIEADSLTLSVLNQVSPASAQSTLMESVSLLFSVQNQAAAAAAPPTSLANRSACCPAEIRRERRNHALKILSFHEKPAVKMPLVGRAVSGGRNYRRYRALGRHSPRRDARLQQRVKRS